MAKITVTLTEDLIKLISHISFQKLPNIEEETEKVEWGLDFFNLYGGDLTFENIAMILGRYDEHIEGTEEEPLGAKFPKELENYMWELHGYIIDHIQDIEEIVHQFCNKGGITAGEYECKTYERIWKKRN